MYFSTVGKDVVSRRDSILCSSGNSPKTNIGRVLYLCNSRVYLCTVSTYSLPERKLTTRVKCRKYNGYMKKEQRRQGIPACGLTS